MDTYRTLLSLREDLSHLLDAAQDKDALQKNPSILAATMAISQSMIAISLSHHVITEIRRELDFEEAIRGGDNQEGEYNG